jgi:hypothetical protein
VRIHGASAFDKHVIIVAAIPLRYDVDRHAMRCQRGARRRMLDEILAARDTL